MALCFMKLKSLLSAEALLVCASVILRWNWLHILNYTVKCEVVFPLLSICKQDVQLIAIDVATNNNRCIATFEAHLLISIHIEDFAAICECSALGICVGASGKNCIGWLSNKHYSQDDIIRLTLKGHIDIVVGQI